MRSRIFKLLRRHKRILFDSIIILISLFAITSGGLILWASAFKLPDLTSFQERKVAQSTKIYDRTGKILLYSLHENIKRTVISGNEISKNIKNATVAIEDAEFYEHNGIKLKAIVRAVLADIRTGKFSQGGSTITQQVIKNTFLTSEKTITRKVKEWVLALRLERVMNKEDILNTYLNEVPYGGNIYGVEEASQAYFGKTSYDLTLGEAAYLAALPQAPTFYSPYGNHKQELTNRKNLVLKKMLEKKFITEDEYKASIAEKVEFRPKEERGIKAPHFVIFVKEYLALKYGEKAIEENGYKVITTLNYELQKKAEDLASKYALENKKNYNAENAAVVAIDPKTGQVLTMVGSRDYFDDQIEGNFNVSLAHRQPGSTFKPIVYAQALRKGYTPETVVFDVKTQFSTNCEPSNLTSENGCYSPDNYDEKFRGPISLRNALAQSINIASVKVLYLAGLKDSLRLAKDMGIESLEKADTYGLTLVLGGGEASLIDMTSAYSVFANEGVRNPYQSILRIEDREGNVIEDFEKHEIPVLTPQVALTVTDMLSDNVARTPLYGANSLLHFPGKDVAVKTGTTNNYKDAWTIGYTPNIVIGAWVGNNDNRPMERKLSGQLVVPLWNAVMKEALKIMPEEKFNKPEAVDISSYKPILRGYWQGGSYIQNIGGTEVFSPEVHTILHYIDTKDPLGPSPSNPANDPQYERWEYGIQSWIKNNGLGNFLLLQPLPSAGNNSGTNSRGVEVEIVNPKEGDSYEVGESIKVRLRFSGEYPIVKANYYINNVFLGTVSSNPFGFSLVLPSVGRYAVKVVLFDSQGGTGESEVTFDVE